MEMEMFGAVSCRFEGGRGRYEAVDDWSSSSVAFVRLPTQSVDEQKLQALTHGHQVSFNLHRRPSRGLAAPSLFLLSPSGFIPNGAEEGRHRGLSFPVALEDPIAISLFVLGYVL
jgi:hypothetical protein